MEGHTADTLSWHSARVLLSHGPHPTVLAGELRDPASLSTCLRSTLSKKVSSKAGIRDGKEALKEKGTGVLGVSEGGLGRRLAGEPMGGTGLSGDAKGKKGKLRMMGDNSSLS